MASAQRAGLVVDGGTAPPPPADDAPEHEPPEGPPIVQPAGLEETPAQWERETVQTLVALPFMAAHVFARRRGPADAWMPDDSELALMTGPLLNMANRYSMLRQLARFGDPVAFAAAVGTYTTAESRRITRWRLEHDVDLDAEPIPDADLAGLHVAAETPQQGTVRPWRPPAVAEP